MNKINWILAAALFLLNQSICFGACPGGRDLQADPGNYQTLIPTLQPCDTLTLAAGNYANDLRITNLNGTSSRPIVIKGPDSGARPIFLGNPVSNVVEISGVGFLELRNIDINAQNLGGDGVNFKGLAHDVILDNLSLNGLSDDQQTVAISANHAPSWNITIRNCVITDAGTGMYLGNSDGNNQFLNGTIENNLIYDTLGYNIEIKYQNPLPTTIPGLPLTQAHTIIRNNVFSKANNAAGGGNARPNLLVDHAPLSGPGQDNYYEIYGNFFFQNPVEALFQGEGNFALYDNLFFTATDSGEPAINIMRHNDAPRDIRVFNNTVVAAGRGITVSGGSASFPQKVIGNAVFAANPISAPDQTNNIADTYLNASGYLNNPFAALGTMDLFPKAGALTGSPLDTGTFNTYTDWNKDFNATSRATFNFRGAYFGEGPNPGWLPQLTKKPATTPPPGDATPPTVSITAPANGAIISSQSVTMISASASDNVGVVGVQFKVDGLNLGAEGAAAPYSVAWNTAQVANGTHTITAVARDAAENTATSAVVTVTVSNTGGPPPNLSPAVSPITTNAVDVDTATPGLQVYEGAAVTYNATISDPNNDPLTWTWFYTVNGGPRLSFLTGSGTLQPAIFNYPIGSAAKTYQWILSVSDGKATTEAALNAGIVALQAPPPGGDVTAPIILISSPANNATALRSVTVQLSGSDNVGVSKVELLVDAQLMQSQAFNPVLPIISTQLTWKVSLAGFHTLSAKAYDAAGNVGQSGTVSVRVHPPQTTAVRFTASSMIVGLLATNQAELALNLNVIPSSADFSMSPEATDDPLTEASKRADEQGRGLTQVGAAVEIEAVDLNTLNFITQFAQPAILTIMYDPSKVKNPTLLGIFFWDETRERWQAMANPSIDTVDHTVSVQTDHLTTFAVYEAAPAGTATGSLTFGAVFSYPNPAKGGKATIHVELPPVDSLEIRLYDLDGHLIDRSDLEGSTTIGINGKQAYEHTLNISRLASGSYMYSVEATKGGQSGRILRKLAIVK